MSDAPGATRTVQRALRLLGIVAALSVLAPSYRTAQRRVRSIGSAVAGHADALSQSLGAPLKERVA